MQLCDTPASQRPCTLALDGWTVLCLDPFPLLLPPFSNPYLGWNDLASPSQGALKTESGAGQPLPPSPQVPGVVRICRSPALIALALSGTVADQSLEPAGTGFLIALSPGLLPGGPGTWFSPGASHFTRVGAPGSPGATSSSWDGEVGEVPCLTACSVPASVQGHRRGTDTHALRQLSI